MKMNGFVLDFSSPSIISGFITGSQVYGTPNEDSDIDLLLWVDDSEIIDMFGKFDDVDKLERQKAHIENKSTDFSVRFGRLNIIFCHTEKEYMAWRKSRDECIKRKPVTRDEAVLIHSKIREEFGV